MKIKIFCFFDVNEKTYKSQIEEYTKRLPWKIEFFELDVQKFSKLNKPQEAFQNLDYIFCMEERGLNPDSIEFAKKISKLTISNGSRLGFIIGAAEGVPEKAKKCANETISLGKMTFPHQLARLLLIEQLYRAWTIIENKSYHK